MISYQVLERQALHWLFEQLLPCHISATKSLMMYMSNHQAENPKKLKNIKKIKKSRRLRKEEHATCLKFENFCTWTSKDVCYVRKRKVTWFFHIGNIHVMDKYQQYVIINSIVHNHWSPYSRHSQQRSKLVNNDTNKKGHTHWHHPSLYTGEPIPNKLNLTTDYYLYGVYAKRFCKRVHICS